MPVEVQRRRDLHEKKGELSRFEAKTTEGGKMVIGY
jgi:hypothetical protein